MTLDVIGIAVFLVIVLLSLMYFGKSVGISVIFSIPISAFLYDRIPFTDNFFSFAKSSTSAEIAKVLLFVIILLVVYIVVRKAVSVVFPWNPLPKVFEGALITAVLSGLLITTLATYINKDFIISNLPSIAKLLEIPNILFWWTLGGLLSLLFILNQS
ncbi:MAG: hypothetical protein AAB513_03580 [Patescibacteria group bacterium]